jgi:hypothetical protein
MNQGGLLLLSCCCASSKIHHPPTLRRAIFSYSDPRDFPATYQSLIEEHAGVLTQFLPGYVEGAPAYACSSVADDADGCYFPGLVMEQSWHVFYGMNISLPPGQLNLKYRMGSRGGPCEGALTSSEFDWL